MRRTLRKWSIALGVLVILDLVTVVLLSSTAGAYEIAFQRTLLLLVLAVFLAGGFSISVVLWFIANRRESQGKEKSDA
jgi:hypothetical protein